MEVKFDDGSRQYKWLNRKHTTMSKAVAYGTAVIDRHSRLRMVETKPPRAYFLAWSALGKLRNWLPPIITKWTEGKLLNAGVRYHKARERKREERQYRLQDEAKARKAKEIAKS